MLIKKIALLALTTTFFGSNASDTALKFHQEFYTGHYQTALKMYKDNGGSIAIQPEVIKIGRSVLAEFKKNTTITGTTKQVLTTLFNTISVLGTLSTGMSLSVALDLMQKNNKDEEIPFEQVFFAIAFNAASISAAVAGKIGALIVQSRTVNQTATLEELLNLIEANNALKR